MTLVAQQIAPDLDRKMMRFALLAVRLGIAPLHLDD
jgi:hypothetical protein